MNDTGDWNSINQLSSISGQISDFWDLVKLRDLLKSNLEPQRITHYPHQSSYAIKQKLAMCILTYPKKVEALQNTIVEHYTLGYSVQVA